MRLNLCYFIVIGGTSSASLHSGQYCPQSCEALLNYVTFNDTDAGLSRKVGHCRSKQYITSAYLCGSIYCRGDDGEVVKWIDSQSSWCLRHSGNALPDFNDILERWNPSDIAKVRRFNKTEALSFPTFDEVALPDPAFFESAFSTLEAAFYEYDIHLVYGWYMIYFWVVVVAIGTATRLVGLIKSVNIRSRQYLPISDGEGIASPKVRSSTIGLNVMFKRFFSTPATFGDRCARPYGWCTIPARAQSCTIFAFVLFNIVACVGNYRLTDGNIYWPEKSAQLLRYVSDRTGIVSLANFPLIWLFGMRNDALLWLTGWGFGTFNAFHRWVARVATVEAVIHSIGYTIMICESGGMTEFLKYWTKHYFWNGELSTIAMCALLLLSLYGLRRAHYELFLVMHIVLSIVALWTMYYHVEIFVDGEWNIFIWPCLAIWIFDRGLRVLRCLVFDWRFWNTKARISYNPDSDLIRMEVPVDRCFLKQAMLQPGCYYYLYALNDLRYLHQSHPFTMAYVYAPSDVSPPTPLRSLSHSGDSSECDSLLNSGSNGSPSMVFLVRPYDGFTSRLRDCCQQHTSDLRVLVEGPYGHSEPLHMFQNVVFVVGGTGIAVPLSHMTRMLSAESMVHTVKIIWAVRQHAFLTLVLEDFRGLLADERVNLEVHVTRRDEAYDDVLGEDLRSVRLLHGRPNIRQSIEATAKDVGSQSLAIVACGPALMADEARKVSVELLATGHNTLEYFEESFKW